MAVQTIRRGQLLSVPATEDELILVGPFMQGESVVRFINVSGTSKFSLGGPVFSDSTLAAVTTAGTVVTLTVPMMKQVDTDNLTASQNRVHCSGVGTWRVEW